MDGLFDEMPWIVKLILGGLMLALVLLLFSLPVALYDGIFKQPIAANKANDYCRSLGFDQYKSFSKIGILSENPVAIKCEYAERYTDLGVRTTQS